MELRWLVTVLHREPCRQGAWFALETDSIKGLTFSHALPQKGKMLSGFLVTEWGRRAILSFTHGWTEVQGSLL